LLADVGKQGAPTPTSTPAGSDDTPYRLITTESDSESKGRWGRRASSVTNPKVEPPRSPANAA